MVSKHRPVRIASWMQMMARLDRRDRVTLKDPKKSAIRLATRIRHGMKATGRIRISKHRRQWAQTVNSIGSMHVNLQNPWQIHWCRNC